jgi:hypothetical protein
MAQKLNNQNKIVNSSSHIHKSKLIMQVSQDSRDYTMNFLFSATFGKVSCIKVHLDGNLTQGKANQRAKINLRRNVDSTKDEGIDPFAINRTKFSSNYFL